MNLVGVEVVMHHQEEASVAEQYLFVEVEAEVDREEFEEEPLGVVLEDLRQEVDAVVLH